MNILFNDEDMAKLEEAKDTKNWHILDTWKQRFIYQKFCCDNDKNTVVEIGMVAGEELKKLIPVQTPLIDTAEQIFAS